MASIQNAMGILREDVHPLKISQSLKACVAELAGIWLGYAREGISPFDVASIEKVKPALALQSLGVALSVESDATDPLMSYIAAKPFGFRLPDEPVSYDPHMLSAVKKGFLLARHFGFKALSDVTRSALSKQNFKALDDGMDQVSIAEYESHIHQDLPVPRLYLQASSGSKSAVRDPGLYLSIFDEDICQVVAQIRDLLYVKDHRALDALSRFENTPDVIRQCAGELLGHFGYEETLDARRRLIGSGSMGMVESKNRLEAIFTELANENEEYDAIVHRLGVYEFNPAFSGYALQRSVDEIVETYKRSPGRFEDPAPAEVYCEVFSVLSRRGLALDATALLAAQGLGFCDAVDLKQSNKTLPMLIGQLSKPLNAMAAGAVMASIKSYPLESIIKHCAGANDRQMSKLFHLTNSKEIAGLMTGRAREMHLSMELGL